MTVRNSHDKPCESLYVIERFFYLSSTVSRQRTIEFVLSRQLVVRFITRRSVVGLIENCGRNFDCKLFPLPVHTFQPFLINLMLFKDVF